MHCFLRSTFFISLIVLALAACETGPVEPPPPSIDFDAELAAAKAQDNPMLAIGRLSELATSPSASPGQQVLARYERGLKRYSSGVNKPGAIEDFQASLADATGVVQDPSLPGKISTLNSQITDHRARLGALQSQSRWMDDKFSIGEMEEAASRFQKNQLTPTAQHTYLLEGAGYICREGGQGQPIFTYDRNAPTHASGLRWCDPVS